MIISPFKKEDVNLLCLSLLIGNMEFVTVLGLNVNEWCFSITVGYTKLTSKLYFIAINHNIYLEINLIHHYHISFHRNSKIHNSP